MRRYTLIVAVAGMTVQPLTPLPLPGKQTTRDRAPDAVGRLASAGCAVDARSDRVDVWNRARLESGSRGPLADARQRNRQMHGRCVPSRECFTNQRPVGTGRGPDSRFRTPTFVGR
jgi:hypothetical protein